MSNTPRRIDLALQERMRALESLAPRFFGEIFELEADEVLWTDESALGDFDGLASYDELYGRIEAVYGCDVRAAGPYVADVLEALRNLGTAT